MKQHKLAVIIAIILFIVPFFWLKLGEMNLGGDSGRLYFYDPTTYLNIHVLYKYLGSSHGSELTYFIYLPFVSLLYLLKLVLQSPTLLISLFNGLTVSIGFFSVYLIARELLTKGDDEEIKPKLLELSAILAGLFYILSQISIYSGWEKPIITFNQVFLNPLMALVLLKFMLKQDVRYMILALLITFVFTPNFSIVGAPPFFAFYPITVIFIFLYAKFIRNVVFQWRLFLVGIIFFFLIHTFHLVSTVQSIFTAGSSYSQSIFSDTDRSGLSYFIAVASTVKYSRIWMSLAQHQDKSYFALFIVFPVIVVLSFILRRGKVMLLTGLFFLICYYFASSVTDTGFFIYKQFFKIPGFSMFRNFYGQWSYILIFFYSLLVGQSIAVILQRVTTRVALWLGIGIGSIIIGFGSPLLFGSVPMPRDPDTGQRNSFRMDSVFEQVLGYFSANPIDGKVLMFPLTGPGYQLIAGQDGGFYRGLPMLSYLGGKSEFGGYETLRPFHNNFLTAMKNRDQETLKRLFSAMNIRWIFFNSDPFIYGEKFGSLYSYISKFTPNGPEEYQSFIETLPVVKVRDFGPNYHLYAVADETYSPHIVIGGAVYTNDELQLLLDAGLQKDNRSVIMPIQNVKSGQDAMVLYGLPNALMAEINSNGHFHKHMPFINRKLDDPFYPLVIVREVIDLVRVKKNPYQYLDFALFLLTKRVEEIRRYGLVMKVSRQPWRKPLPWEIYRWFSYNSWEASLSRYETGMEEIISWINRASVSEEERLLFRTKINEQLFQHEIVLLRALHELNNENSEKIYLLANINSIYERLFHALSLPVIDPSKYTYRISPYLHREGIYDVFLQGEKITKPLWETMTLAVGDRILTPDTAQIRLADKDETPITLVLPIRNMVRGVKWKNSGIPLNEVDGVTDMTLNNTLGDLTAGLTLEIPGWSPEKTYLISFDYKTDGDDFIFSFIDTRPLNDSIRKSAYNILFEKRLTSQNFQTHQSVVFAEANSSGGFLKIVPFSSKDTGTIKIRNMIVQKVDYPNIAFKKVVPEMTIGKQTPSITFKKINPTKYILDIRGATTPYTLVFLEAYNQNWRLFNPDSDTASFRGSIARLLGRIGRGLVGMFVKKSEPSDRIEAIYRDGAIQEKAVTNTFIDVRTFDTWGKNTVLERNHTSADGYANAWTMTPSDMAGKADYTLILELSTQKLFYLTIIISLASVASLLFYLMKVLLWSKKR